MRVVLISTPDFDASYHVIEPELGVSMVFGHIDIYYWGPSVYRSLMDTWSQVRPTLPDIVFTMGDNPGPKFHKFVTLLGFRPLLDAPCTDGQTRTIYASFKDE